MGNYPWLADSWPTSNLVHGGKEAMNCCAASHDTTERYYNGIIAAAAPFISSTGATRWAKRPPHSPQTQASPTT